MLSKVTRFLVRRFGLGAVLNELSVICDEQGFEEFASLRRDPIIEAAWNGMALALKNRAHVAKEYGLYSEPMQFGLGDVITDDAEETVGLVVKVCRARRLYEVQTRADPVVVWNIVDEAAKRL